MVCHSAEHGGMVFFDTPLLLVKTVKIRGPRKTRPFEYFTFFNTVLLKMLEFHIFSRIVQRESVYSPQNQKARSHPSLPEYLDTFVYLFGPFSLVICKNFAFFVQKTLVKGYFKKIFEARGHTLIPPSFLLKFALILDTFSTFIAKILDFFNKKQLLITDIYHTFWI